MVVASSYFLRQYVVPVKSDSLDEICMCLDIQSNPGTAIV